MVKTKLNTTQDIIDILQQIKARSKSKIYHNISNFHDKMNCSRQSRTFQFEEDPFIKMQKV